MTVQTAEKTNTALNIGGTYGITFSWYSPVKFPWYSRLILFLAGWTYTYDKNGVDDLYWK